jgi:hypothetical protein
MSMARTSDYEKQLRESCRLVAESLHLSPSQWRLVYQSRSGRPEDPWLEPDILDYVKELKDRGETSVVISPVGFLSDHMEVLYDLDDAAKHTCDEQGITMHRAGTPGSHPRFIAMIRKLIQERLTGCDKECTGQFPANHDVCPVDCCPAPARPPGRPEQSRNRLRSLKEARRREPSGFTSPDGLRRSATSGSSPGLQANRPVDFDALVENVFRSILDPNVSMARLTPAVSANRSAPGARFMLPRTAFLPLKW